MGGADSERVVAYSLGGTVVGVASASPWLAACALIARALPLGSRGILAAL